MSRICQTYLARVKAIRGSLQLLKYGISTLIPKLEADKPLGLFRRGSSRGIKAPRRLIRSVAISTLDVGNAVY